MRQSIGALAITAAAVVMAGCNWVTVEGDGEAENESRSAAGFTAIDARSSLDVSVEQGRVFRIELHIDRNLVPLVTTRIEDGTLVIDTERSVDPHVGGPHVFVTMPSLSRADLSGSGRLSISPWEGDAALQLELSGSGDLAFEGKMPAIEANLSGSGEVRLTGSTDRVDFELSGSGKLDGKSLSAKGARADLSGSGQILANVDGPVAIDLSGSGDIDLFGRPRLGPDSESGSGQVTIH